MNRGQTVPAEWTCNAERRSHIVP